MKEQQELTFEMRMISYTSLINKQTGLIISVYFAYFLNQPQSNPTIYLKLTHFSPQLTHLPNSSSLDVLLPKPVPSIFKPQPQLFPIIKIFKKTMSFEKLQVFGNTPLPRFGHSITLYAENKVCLFGGATGNTGQFSITDNTYTLDLSSRFWKKVETTGTSPSARAAHGAVCVETNKIVIYGGATGSGGLASDDLFHLDIREGVGIWNVINVRDRTPGKRYGHTLSYSKPYLVVFGGNIGDKSVNDCWVLNITKPPLAWSQVKCQGDLPCARVYHSAALCTSGTAGGMIVIFGGRGLDNNPLSDSWGLRRHRTGRWDWVRAPEKSTPSARYQHSSLFVGSLMLVVGGRTNSVNQKLPLQVFNTETSEWSSFDSLQRFRHGCWMQDKMLMIYGGFQLSTPNVPTDSIYKVSLTKLFDSSPSLASKLKAIQTNQSQVDKVDLVESTGMITRVGQTTPTIKQSESQRISDPIKPVSQARKKRPRILDPVIGGDKTKLTTADPKKKLNSKMDIAAYFLDMLLQPAVYMNAEALKINFRADQIIALCNLAEQIIISQPMILQAKPPLKIFGDIHGQFTDLMSFFALYGTPHQNGKKKDIQNFDYIFLGDFVDRGSHSLETICLLLALKCIYPEQVHLIRGNHQDSQININFGFRDECAEKIEEEPQSEDSVFTRINKLFDWLPLAALIEDKILCLHGGIGASLNTLEDIQKINRPLQVMHEVQDDESQVVLDILWSDPTESDSELGIYANHLRDPSETGNIVKFGPDRVKSFLAKNNLNMIIRAHECVMDGFQRFAGGALITVFSATDYCRKHKNAGAILILKTNYEIIPKMIYPSNTNENNWIQDEEQLKKRPPTPPRWRNQRNY